ncbi:cytochrome P450 87A3-like [Fagus crenata]
MWIVIMCLTALLIVRFSHWVYTWGNPKCNGKLPPGSMGLPIIGETLEFFTPHSFYGIPSFITKRMARYGPLFRTSLVGQKVIVSTDPEINYYIFQQEGKSFILWYTESFMKVFGDKSIIANHGLIHNNLKNLIRHLMGPENLKNNLIHELDVLIRGQLHSWAKHATVDLKEVTSNMMFNYSAKKLISYDESKASRKLKDNFEAFMYGLISFPLNIPGTTYHACLKGRKNVVKAVKDIFEERKATKMPHNDFLDHLLEEMNKEKTILNEAIIVDMILVLLFATYESASTAMTLIVKFISDHPKVLAELTGKELHSGSKTFMAFGGGVRLCVGADFAKLQFAIFIHYLITKYRWKFTKGEDIIRRPGLVFPNGLTIEISEKVRSEEDE